jgi:hypothetical protein
LSASSQSTSKPFLSHWKKSSTGRAIGVSTSRAQKPQDWASALSRMRAFSAYRQRSCRRRTCAGYFGQLGAQRARARVCNARANMPTP